VGYRLRRPTQPGVVLHFEDIPEHERTAIDGVPATTVARAIRDCAYANLGPALLRQALDDGRRTGWLTAHEMEALTAELTAAGKLQPSHYTVAAPAAMRMSDRDTASVRQYGAPAHSIVREVALQGYCARKTA
jgi:hypothetical protein